METETTTQKPKGIAWAWLAWRGLSRGPRMALGVAVIGLLAALLAALLFLPGRRNGHKVVTTAQASLKQALAISELSTLDYTYAIRVNGNPAARCELAPDLDIFGIHQPD